MARSKKQRRVKDDDFSDFAVLEQDREDEFQGFTSNSQNDDVGFHELYDDPGEFVDKDLIDDLDEEEEKDDKEDKEELTGVVEKSDESKDDPKEDIKDPDIIDEVLGPLEALLNHPAEQAALYQLQNPKNGPVGGSDAQILKDLRKMVFSVPLLQQKEVHRLFKGIDAELNPLVYKILSCSGFFFEQIIQIVAKVAAGNTYGKNIYEKVDVPAEEKGQKKPYKELYKDHEIVFLTNAYQLIRLYAQSVTTQAPTKPTQIADAMERCHFIRGVFEDILQGFVEGTKKYHDLHWQAALAKVRDEQSKYDSLTDLIAITDRKYSINKFGYAVTREASRVFMFYQKTRSTIIAPYLRSVYSAAKKTARNAHQMLDNFQNGSIGLMRAVSCYSVLRPASFASVAKWWIKQMMLLSIKEDANFVKLPVSTWQAYTQLEKARTRLGVGEDKMDEVAEAAKMPLKKAQSVYHTVKIAQVYSLNRTYGSDEKLALEDIITDDCKIGLQGEDFGELLREYCERAKLSDLEIKIVALRNGMPDLLPNTLIDTNSQIREAIIQNLANLGYNFKFV